MNLSDAYSILECSNTSSIEDIRATYRKMSLKCHPDITGRSSEEFLLLSDAYHLLKEKHKQKKVLDTQERLKLYRFAPTRGYNVVLVPEEALRCDSIIFLMTYHGEIYLEIQKGTPEGTAYTFKDSKFVIKVDKSYG